MTPAEAARRRINPPLMSREPVTAAFAMRVRVELYGMPEGDQPEYWMLAAAQEAVMAAFEGDGRHTLWAVPEKGGE